MRAGKRQWDELHCELPLLSAGLSPPQKAELQRLSRDAELSGVETALWALDENGQGAPFLAGYRDGYITRCAAGRMCRIGNVLIFRSNRGGFRRNASGIC